MVVFGRCVLHVHSYFYILAIPEMQNEIKMIIDPEVPLETNQHDVQSARRKLYLCEWLQRDG